VAFDAAERAAIEGRDMPEHSLDGCTCEEAMIDGLYISPEAFHQAPQVGVPWSMPFSALAAYCSRPSIGDGKDIAGGNAFGVYTDNTRRKLNLLRLRALVFDFDASGVSDVAPRLTRYRAICHETWSSTDDAQRCRVIIELAEDIDAVTYDRVHAVLRAFFRSAGLAPDEGAKDPCRLSFAPVRRAGAGFRFAVTDGPPLDAHKVLASQPPTTPRATPQLPDPQHASAYTRGALRRAAGAVANATPGERHYALSRETFTLARLELANHEIHATLLPAFVAAAGEARRHEGERTIADAIRARRGVS
jgi:hypothetical protein